MHILIHTHIHQPTNFIHFLLLISQALQEQVKQLESEIEQLREKLSQTEAARDKFSGKAAELNQELTSLRLNNSILAQQVDSLRGEEGVAELVQQDLGHVLKLIEEGVGEGEMKVGVCPCERERKCV